MILWYLRSENTCSGTIIDLIVVYLSLMVHTRRKYCKKKNNVCIYISIHAQHLSNLEYVDIIKQVVQSKDYVSFVDNLI